MVSISKYITRMDAFTKARLKLTFQFFIIILFIVGTFSAIFIINQFSELDRFYHIRDNIVILTDNPIIQQQILTERQTIEKAVTQLKFNIISDSLIIDTIIVSLSLIISFYLSGEALKPIKNNMDKQRKFVADASHELRTPLTSIKTEAEVLARGKNVTNEEYKDFTNSVIEEVDKLTELTTNLLTIAKYDSDSEKTTITEFELDEAIKNCINRFASISKVKKVKINYISPENKIIIKNDKQKVERLLCIFIDNSIKYNKENGEIDIKIATDPEKNKTELTIQDTGIGIEKEHLNKIFDRFYRVSEDRAQKGFGLGLSIAKQISQQLDIELKIESEKDKGTKVNLKF